MKHGSFQPMIKGVKVMAIFGFCDIRNFTNATEILQTKVMVFVNQIAEVVHTQVDKFGGSANKNIGDAFLLVWKFDQSDVKEHKKRRGSMILRKKKKSVLDLADLSLFSLLKVIGKINKLKQILEYSKDPALTARMENYKVKLGFGLHVGWAIEGAIGSEFKIDASYLS
jgi:class 3 adenylate cyclase